MSRRVEMHVIGREMHQCKQGAILVFVGVPAELGLKFVQPQAKAIGAGVEQHGVGLRLKMKPVGPTLVTPISGAVHVIGRNFCLCNISQQLVLAHHF